MDVKQRKYDLQTDASHPSSIVQLWAVSRLPCRDLFHHNCKIAKAGGPAGTGSLFG